MAISWNTLDKETPLVRGDPAQFEEVASSFSRVESQTRFLSEELKEIRLGESEGFAGEAANSLQGIIGEIYISLSDVPRIATDISDIFRDHGTSLAAIKREARSALARAQTHWNAKTQAEHDIDSCRSSLRSLESQISALDGSHDPSADDARARLETRRASVSGQLDHARRDLATAENRLDDSRRDWDRIRGEEDELNEHTKNRLNGVELWSLTDTGNFITEGASNFFEGLAEALEAIWNYISENIIEQLFHFLDTLLGWLEVIGLVLEFIPIVGQIYKVIEVTVVGLKALAGLALVLQGKMEWSHFLLSTAIDLVGSIPGVPRVLIKAIAKPTLKVTGAATKALGKTVKTVGKGVNEVSRRADDALEDASKLIDAGGDLIEYEFKRVGKVANKLANQTADVVRRADLNWERHIRKSGDIMEKGLRKTGEIIDEVIDDFADIVKGLGDGIGYVGDELGDLIVGMGDDLILLGDDLIRFGDDLEILTGPGDLLKEDILTDITEEGLKYIRDRTLGDPSEPVRTDRYPRLEPCRFDERLAVAA